MKITLMKNDKVLFLMSVCCHGFFTDVVEPQMLVTTVKPKRHVLYITHSFTQSHVNLEYLVLHPSNLQKVFSFIIFIKERYSFTILSEKKAELLEARREQS